MKWGMFKKLVEKEGITDDWVIEWIDFGSFGSLLGEVNVGKNEEDKSFSVSD